MGEMNRWINNLISRLISESTIKERKVGVNRQLAISKTYERNFANQAKTNRGLLDGQKLIFKTMEMNGARNQEAFVRLMEESQTTESSLRVRLGNQMSANKNQSG